MAIEIEPTHTEGYLGLGDLMLRLNRPDDAVEQIRRAVEVRPASPHARYRLGDALAAAGRTPAAIHEYQTALALDARFAPAHAGLMRVYVQLGELEKAEFHRREAHRLITEMYGADAIPRRR
jgi:tetratricopeptide (TPR) repeat protein